MDLTKWFDSLTDPGFAFGGVGLAVNAILVLVAAWLVPRPQKAKVRLAAVFLSLLALVVAIRAVLPAESVLRKPIEVIAIFLLLSCMGRAGFLLSVDWLLGHRLGKPLPRIFRDIVQVLVYFGIVILTLRAMGAAPGSLITTSALLTAIVGLSLQETLGNLFAGLAIQAQKPFEIGDFILVQGAPPETTGKIVEINWRAAIIKTDDRMEIIVPNSVLVKSPIINYSRPEPIIRRRVEVQGPYDVPPHVVEDALLEAARRCPGVLENPPPTTWVSSFGDSGINYTLTYYLSDFSGRSAIDSSVRRRIWYCFARAGISIPFPVRDVHVVASSDGSANQADAIRCAERARRLHQVDFLKVLPESALQLLASDSRVCFYGAGEEIIRQGDQGAELFILERGEAVVFVSQGDYKPVEVARLKPGNVFGEMALVTGETRSATVCAASPCELIVVGHEAFRKVLEAHPDLAQRISEVLASRRAENRQVHSSENDAAPVVQSAMLLDRIRDFFSLGGNSR